MDLAEAKGIWDKKYPRPGLSAKGREAIDWLIAEVEQQTAYCHTWARSISVIAAERDRYRALLQSALPHILCDTDEQCALITAIGEALAVDEARDSIAFLRGKPV